MNWPAWIAAAAAVAALIIAAKPLHWAYRLLIGTHEFIADWPKMKADIAGLKSEVAHIRAETLPNGGHSLRDIVHRTAADVAEIKYEQAGVRTRLELLDVKQTPPPRTRKTPPS